LQTKITCPKIQFAARLAGHYCNNQQIINQQWLGAVVFKLRFSYIQIQFINQVLLPGGRIIEASPAANRHKTLQHQLCAIISSSSDLTNKTR
jgi:hypothetical protein